ncbi:MAG: hypothetical protein JNM84_12535 [Planctomycetes bacterium]|nr:hypothetical protein [Planctomycetota bacterium]
MSWYVRLTRFASVHMVHSQHAQNSCGMSSIAMINFKMKKGLLFAGMAAKAGFSIVPVVGSHVGSMLAKAAIATATKTEEQVYAEYTKVTGAPYDGSQYSDAMHFPAVLNNLGLGNWECVNVGEGGFAKAAKSATDSGAPVIGHVVWNGGGAHFVVIDENHLGYGCVCDPWDGHLHVVKMSDGKAVSYDAGNEPIGFDLGGKRNDYPTGQMGKFSGWIVRRK